jgi:prepilin-type N-terminal cleavage/methylation domain-containing protein
MLRKIRQQNTSGFTIIEVMIVLAIAGFIMGIVFIAIPQLQRSSRNTARENDASLISAGVGDCLTNKNGVITSCNEWVSGTTPELQSFVDNTRLKQLTGTPTTGTTAGTAGTDYSTTVPRIVTGSKCDAETDGIVPGTAREYAILYQVETTSGTVTRCIGS